MINRLTLLLSCCFIFLVFITGINSYGGPPKPVSDNKDQERSFNMLTVDEIRNALADNADIVLVTVQKTSLEMAGTRSQQARYQLRIQQSITGNLSGLIDAWHYGNILLEGDKLYVVSLLSTRRFENAVKLLAYSEVPESMKDAVIKAYIEKIKLLLTPLQDKR